MKQLFCGLFTNVSCVVLSVMTFVSRIHDFCDEAVTFVMLNMLSATFCIKGSVGLSLLYQGFMTFVMLNAYLCYFAVACLAHL
jgi:hypothetical protein